MVHHHGANEKEKLGGNDYYVLVGVRDAGFRKFFYAFRCVAISLRLPRAAFICPRQLMWWVTLTHTSLSQLALFGFEYASEAVKGGGGG